jgi:hypothetical protein
MGLTQKQFALFNVPTEFDAYVPPEDAWLFSEPVKIFDIGTPEEMVLKTYHTARKARDRRIGMGRISSRIILKVRHVHYTDFVKVPGVDVVKEPSG